MRPSGTLPAVAHAVDFIKAQLESGVWKQGECLPSIRQLAAMAAVSRGTIASALALLKQDGLVSGTERYRTRAGAASDAVALKYEKSERWHRHRKRLERDLLSGVWGTQGVLPSFKELQGHYGVSFGTIQKITAAMVDEGVLVHHGKGYARPELPAHAYKPQIIFVTCRDHVQQISALNSQHNHIVNLFESECTKTGFRFAVQEVDVFDPVVSRRAVLGPVNNDSIVGFILDVWWYPSENLRRAYIDLLGRLASYRKPVTILDEVGDFVLPLQCTGNPLLQVYTIESERAGARIARYLWELGHREIAYISLVHQASWSRARFTGVAHLYDGSAAGGAKVRLIPGKGSEPLFAGLLTQSGLDDDVVRGLISVGRTSSQAVETEKAWVEFCRSHTPPYEGYPQLSDTLCSNLSLLAPLVRQPQKDRLFFEKTILAALDAVGTRTFQMDLQPLFEQALSHNTVTAWVCANDGIAIEALSFLRNRRISVPDEVSVVGFDNIPVQSLQAGLTTFDFNALGFVQHILGFILHPPRQRGPYRHSTIEIEGMIIERGTTAKANRT